jgi:hypothetical protein
MGPSLEPFVVAVGEHTIADADFEDVAASRTSTRSWPMNSYRPSLLPFEYSARTIEVPGGYEMELTEAEARTLLTYARSAHLRPGGWRQPAKRVQ